MRLKSKIMMAVLAIVFMAAGSASAIPINVAYTVSGSLGDYDLNFAIENNVVGLKVTWFGLEYNGITETVPVGMVAKNTVNNGGILYHRFYIPLPSLLTGDIISGLKVGVNDIPVDGSLHFYVLGFLNDSTSTTRIDGFAVDPPTGAVPEPATLLLLGLGLVGMAGLRRKLRK